MQIICPFPADFHKCLTKYTSLSCVKLQHTLKTSIHLSTLDLLINMDKPDIIEVTPSNIDRYGVGCIRNKNHPGVKEKIKWYKDHYHTGLRMLQAYVDGKLSGFLEYVSGGNPWRPVIAEDYLFIHCIWVYENRLQGEGLGSLLINKCIDAARDSERLGVATISSRGSWLADERIFLKNGFEKITSKERFDLLVFKLKRGRLPEFIKWEEQAGDHPGTTLVLSHQCPANARALQDIERIAEEEGIDLNINFLRDVCQAQRAPSGFGVFQLLHNGKVLEDHYISGTRFRNIIREDIIRS